MANVQLNVAPGSLSGVLVPGDGVTFTATSESGDWPATTRLRVLNASSIETAFTPTIATTLATWTLTVAEVTALLGTKTTGSLSARITHGTGDSLRPVKAGKLSLVSKWQGVSSAQSLGTVTLGPAGPGVPVGGTTGQVLAKTSGTDYDTEWVDAPTLDTEGVQDIIGAMVAAAGGSYNDAAGTITLPTAGDAITVGPTAPVSGWWLEVPLPTVIPTAPTSDDTANTYTIPTTLGVDYQIGGSTVAAGIYSVGNIATTVAVSAVAQDGYALTGTTSWTLTFTVTDTTAPTAGTLSVTAHTSTTIDVSVSGAADETALHATPYAFSSDNGSTWGAYQAGPTHQFTGLSPSTAYTVRHRVRDAVGNVSTGTGVAQSTDAAPADTTPPTVGTMAASSITSSGFTLTVSGAADETALHATPYAFTTDGESTWSAYQSSAAYVASGMAASTGYSCNWRVKDAAGNVSTGTAATVITGAPAGTSIAASYHNLLADAAGSADGTSYSWTSSLGTAHANRNIVCVILGRKADPGATVSSVTIAGVAATVDHYTTSAGSTAAVAHAHVPTGTTGTVAVTWSEAMLRCNVGVLSATPAETTTLTVDDTASGTASGTASVSTTLDATTDGLLVAGLINGGTAGDAVTWTGATEDFDVPAETSRVAGAHATPAATGSVTVTATSVGSQVAAALVAVSYK